MTLLTLSAALFVRGLAAFSLLRRLLHRTPDCCYRAV